MDLLKRLSLEKHDVDSKPHITVNLDICAKCKEKPCVRVCPAGTYDPDPEKIMIVHYERCVECSAALVACPYGSIKFSYPEKGVSYTYG
ncbi:ferredoxin family protein [Picrophilus oshimae]|uniref:Ferredoxin-like protein FixX n=1 Tax=Picrophilus torridus (strain ATCC 700027 / DSM 9790 / JCM 10055 / NBRC 100828 / KAW 2/3) TaxID=1122961 RepID=A0A8G2L753_PICTO|nr:4Fe-4S dicluster domain-containing protein [Picrophilus oshimae]SMD30717.1 Ferredoxin-like protein FixX [Picrophilus oshimae DSM 9789]